MNAKKPRPKPVLIVQHAAHEHPAAIKRALDSQGIQTIWLHPYRGDPYPSISEIRGMISLGGSMGANDEELHPWILPELELLRSCVETGKPTVGVCLGGQMMSRALGGQVVKNHVSEVGWFPIQVNDAGRQDRILGSAGGTPVVFHWHFDTFSLPSGAELLAHSSHCERQAYRIGDHAYGFQFHPEADHQLVYEWLAEEGIENEILSVQKQHGSESVQDAETQRSHALRGEKASLKITAGIGQLFRQTDYEPIPRSEHQQYSQWMTDRTLLILKVEGSNGRPIKMRGYISTLLTITDGEFAIFKDESTVLWPVRLDHVKSVQLASR